MKPVRFARLAIVSALFVLGASGCVRGDINTHGTNGSAIVPVSGKLVPPTLLGLAVQPEDVTTTVRRFHRTYVKQLSMYSLRQGDLLAATLQVAKLNQTAEHAPKFQLAVVNQIGGAQAHTERLGRDTVYMTTTTRQKVSVWFRGEYLFILAVRDDFDQPRTLQREALAIGSEAGR